jgi:two-component system CheB/CheR fusion protein
MLAQTLEYAVIGLSLDARIMGWHGAAARLFGYTAKEIVGAPFTTLFTSEDIDMRIPEVEVELARQTGRSEDDRWHLRKDGSRFWSNGVLNRHYSEQHELIGFVKVLRDRTDLRTRVEGLQNRVDRLSEDIARERQLRATLVHELRNPLSPLVHALGIIGSTDDAGMRQRMLAMMARQTEMLQRLLDDAAESTPRQDAAPLQLRTLVLQDVIRPLVEALRRDAVAKGLSLVFVAPEIAVVIEADPPRVEQMVLNLLSNSLKYTSSGGHVTVSVTIEGDMAVIRIDDDGAGIAKENLERVFDLFTRENEDTTVPGFGVGLAVVKRLAWQHGGFIEARSPGKGLGSQFTLQLPLRARRPAA